MTRLCIYCETGDGAHWAAAVLSRHLLEDLHHNGIQAMADTVVVELAVATDDPVAWLQDYLLDCGSAYVPSRKDIAVEIPF